MSDPSKHEYKINIGVRILELLGPSLYTNIYYILAELIANAYDADASNVYVIQEGDRIIVEDDGAGMSYDEGDIGRYLNVGLETRTTAKDSYTQRGRKKMGRKGVGKLAALSVSENVLVMTRKKGAEEGFVLSRHVGVDNKLDPIKQGDIEFKRIGHLDGTSIVMKEPQYKLHKTSDAIKRNLIKLFPLVDQTFRIHIIAESYEVVIDSADKEIIQGLGGLIILGEEHYHLADHFDCCLADKTKHQELLKLEDAKIFSCFLKNKAGEEKTYDLEIRGWIGAYRTTRDRKKDPNDFPDNFISLLSNGKLGEYNILPSVGKNRLNEVYIVGQLHINLFEETELPDMALSNRQGYKNDDTRYEIVINYIADELLPRVLRLREVWSDSNAMLKKQAKQEKQKRGEEELRKKVYQYKNAASKSAAEKVTQELQAGRSSDIEEIIQNELNELLPIVGIKKRVDGQKKKILISHTRVDKPLCDVVYKMLSFNGAPDEDIIYTSCENEDCRIPEGTNVFDYLRDFFVDSVSDEKIFVIYITSDEMARAWFAVTEVGAGWITKKSHKVFTINGYVPRKPLDTDVEWHDSRTEGDKITMNSVEFDRFIIKIVDICGSLGYKAIDKAANEKELHRYVTRIDLDAHPIST